MAQLFCEFRSIVGERGVVTNAVFIVNDVNQVAKKRTRVMNQIDTKIARLTGTFSLINTISNEERTRQEFASFNTCKNGVGYITVKQSCQNRPKKNCGDQQYKNASDEKSVFHGFIRQSLQIYTRHRRR